MKNINLFLGVAFFLLSLNTKAQAIYDWALHVGGSGASFLLADEAKCVATDNSGNVYIAGSFFNTPDFDPGPGTQTITSAGSGDGFIAKYDPNGNFLAVYTFTNTLDCKVYSIDIDNAGNIVATGNFQGTVDFDPTVGFYGLSSPSGYDFFVMKLNAAGTFSWAVKIGASGVDDFGYGIDTDLNNDVLVTGYFIGVVDFNPAAAVNNLTTTAGGDGFVLKLTSAGLFSWALNFGGNNVQDQGNTISTDAPGNVYVGGFFQGVADFDPSASASTLSASGGQSGFLCKYSSAGNYIWAKHFDGTGRSSINSLNINSGGDVFSVGSFTGNIDSDPGVGTSTLLANNTLNDIFIVRLTSSGNFVWANKVGGTGDDTPNTVTSDASGIYYAGYFSGNVDFDPGVGTYTKTSAGGRDYFISKLDLNGSHLYSYSGGNSGSDDKVYGIVTPSTNLIYAAGTFWGTVDFNPNPLTSANLASTGGYDGFLLKLKSCVPTLSVSATPSVICIGSGANSTLTALGSNTVTWSTSATSTVIVVTPTISTNYSVTSSFTTGCVDTQTIDIVVSNCTSLSNNSITQSETIIYPNPSNGSFIFTTNQPGTYHIYNSLGQSVKIVEIKVANEKFQLSELASGIYYLMGRSISEKIIISN